MKETVLDPVYRYHTSVIADPFEILGIEKPAVNMTVRCIRSLKTTTFHFYDKNFIAGEGKA